MTGSKITSLTSEQLRRARAQGQSGSDWERVRRALQEDAQAARAAQTHSAGGDQAAQAQPPTGGQAETADKANDAAT